MNFYDDVTKMFLFTTNTTLFCAAPWVCRKQNAREGTDVGSSPQFWQVTTMFLENARVCVFHLLFVHCDVPTAQPVLMGKRLRAPCRNNQAAKQKHRQGNEKCRGTKLIRNRAGFEGGNLG